MNRKNNSAAGRNRKRPPPNGHKKSRGNRGDEQHRIATIQTERDALAEAVLDRLMPIFGPIDFKKKDLLREIESQPSLEELIESLPAESES